MADHETQLHPADEAALDNQDRNKVRPQTQEPYGDQELAVESKVHFSHHFAGQPLETVADRDANEQLRQERYERAQIDPVYRRQQKIDVAEEDKLVHMHEVAVPLLYEEPRADDLSDEELERLTAPGAPDLEQRDHSHDRGELTEDELNQAEQEHEHQLDDKQDEDAPDEGEKEVS